MKKILFFASALAGLFLASSCQRESLEPEVSGNVVSYTIQVPQALSTKVIGENVSAVNELVYAVYRTEATAADDYTQTETKLFQKTAVITNGTATVDFELVNNQNFRILFWAHVNTQETPSVYTTTDLKNVTLSQSLTANAENYAAFAGSDFIKYGDNINGRTVTLVRPIAQLNIATAPGSLDVEGQTTVKMTTTGVTVTGLSTSYNVAEAHAGDVATTAFTYAPAAVSGLSEDKLSVNGTSYDYVAMNYVGFAEHSGSNVEVSYTINTENVGTISNTIKNVPVKANYRTNIVGNLITSMSDYTITLDAEWEDEDKNVGVVSVSTASSLQEAINAIPDGVEGNITLTDDIDLSALASMISTKAAAPTYGLIIPADKSLVLDLNGNTLAQTVSQTGAYSMIQNNGNLTIIDSKGTGKIAYGDTGNGGEYVSNTIHNSGKLVIESGLIENNSSATVAANGYPHPIDNSGELTINGGTITNNAHYSSMRIWCTTDDDTSVTINGGTFNGSIDFQTVNGNPNKGILTINAGTFNPDTYTKSSVRLLGFGADVDEMLGYINGGTFNGEIALRNWSGAEFNSQVFYITGGQFSVDPSAFVVDGYPVVAPETEGGYFTIGEYTTVAKIGDQEYGSLRAAVAAAQEGETIILIKNIEQADGVIITDKKLTIDLNDKTFTVSEGANTNNRNFKINGSSVVTIKNGTMVAAGDYSSGAYGTVRTEGTANVTLTDVKLYNYRGNGLNVKALSGTTVTISDTEVYSEYGGGIESAGGTIELTNVKVDQKGMYTAPYNSMAISVNGGGTVTVKSGTYSTECITAEEANNQGTSHGPWCAGVLNSGGTLIIEGGTFSNDNFGENSLATYARGLLLADTGANIEINGGTFNAVKSIIDIQNNLGDASKNPKVLLAGGNYSSNPLTWAGLISAVEGKGVVEGEDGRWTLVKVQANNEIWYTATALVHAHYYKDKFGEGTDLVSNVWDETTGKGVITLSGPITKISGNAFYDRDALISISFPNSVTTIGDNNNSVFSGCPNLETVKFGSNVQFIGFQAFWGCANLKNVVLPESLTTIGEGAFNSCTALKTITIPAGVTSIGDFAFNGISDLKVYCKPTTPPTVGSTPFNKWWAEIYVPAASLTAYQEAWGSVCDNIYAE